MPLNMNTFKIFVSAESMGPPNKGVARLQPPSPKAKFRKNSFY